jgi:parallel beta-helix repeat protein
VGEGEKMKRSVKKMLTFLVVGTVLLATTAPVLAVELTKDIDIDDLFPTIDLIGIDDLFPTIELEPPLFCWDNIPGNDSELLLKFLMDEFDITRTENATISKYNNNTIINISTDELSVEIIMDESEEEVTITIDDGRTYYLEVKKQDGKLNIFVPSGSGPARIWYVDDDGSSGDTIIVRDGTYTENIKIKRDWSFHPFGYLGWEIRSENGPDSTTVRALNSNDHVFEVTGYDKLFAVQVHICGFTIKGAYDGAGIYLHGVDHCTISNNNFSSNSIGIKLKNSDGNLITHNNAKFNNDSGLEMDYNSLDNKVYLNNFDVPPLTPLSTPQLFFSLNRMDANKYEYYNGHVPFRVEDYNYTVYGFVINDGGAGNVAIVASTSPLEHVLSGLCVREFKIDEWSQYKIEITGEMHEQSVYFRPHQEYSLIIESPSATSSAEWPLGKAYWVEVFDIKLTPSSSSKSMPIDLSSTNQNYQYHGRNYTGYLGNYWVGYDGVDEDGNGIGDTSYRIISGGIDNYPLMAPFENYRIEE